MVRLILLIWGTLVSVSCAQTWVLSQPQLSSNTRVFWVQQEAKNFGLESWIQELRYSSTLKADIDPKVSVYLKPQFNAIIHPNTTDVQAHFQEAYLSLWPTDGLYLDVGKKSMKWGSAYAWNVINHIIQSENPLTIQNPNYENMVQTQYYFDKNHSLTAIQWIGRDKSALRAHMSLEALDFNLFLLHPRKNTVALGLDTSWALGENAVLYCEVLQESSSKNIVLGVQSTDESGLNMIFEYFYNPQGRTPQQIAQINQSGARLYYGVPFAQWREHYAFIRFAKDHIGPTTLALETFYSPQEGSFVFIPKWYWPISDTVDASLEWLVPGGPDKNEFRAYFETFMRLQMNLFF